MRDGIYEQVVSKELKNKLDTLNEKNKYIENIDVAEAPSILTDYFSKVLRKSLENVNDRTENLSQQIELVNRILKVVSETSDEIVEDGEQLKAIMTDNAEITLKGKTAAKVIRPETSIACSSLFTGSAREPKMYTELIKEIQSADRIDMLVSFIRWSGLRLMLDELKEFTNKGGQLRIVTTTYMAATELKAIVELNKLQNTEIRISYDTEHTRMHAKAYIFHRNTGFSTAYVGSSNLTNPALTSGLEWNLKITLNDMRDIFEKIDATFNVYWNSSEFEKYSDESYEILRTALKKNNSKNVNGISSYYFDIQPYPYQKYILDKLEAERTTLGHYKNLVIAATGTGKTIIAAFDYKAQCEKQNKSVSLLFIAHRKEILEQSRECFREVLNNPTFGGLLVGDNEPEDIDHLFISVSMANSRKLWDVVGKDRYEMIILDECHHMKANSYQPIMQNFTPKIFLGLTATPERMDGGDILEYFDHRIAAEIRLAEAIDRKLLCPFQYYGLADSVDLQDVKWSKGGYDTVELENVYVLSTEIAKKRAKHIINSLSNYVADVDEMKAIAFCVSKKHARFMSDMFNEAGIDSVAVVSGDTESDNCRKLAKSQLSTGEIKVVCAVDIYNEGVDIKAINTVLFLRPTDSITVFLQQLGRGLRHCEGKECLTVLDFVGQSNKRYSFESKYAALLSGNNRGIKREIELDFPDVPRGCYIKLEKKVKEVILSNIRNSIGYKNGLVDKIRYFEADTGKALTLYNFLSYYKVDPRLIYRNKVTFNQLVCQANSKDDNIYNDNKAWRQINHLSLIDSKLWITYILNNLESNIKYENCTESEKQYWKMFCASFYDDGLKDCKDYCKLAQAYLDNNKELIAEIRDLLLYRLDEIDFVASSSGLPYENGLETYCTYTRAQALATLDYWNTSSEGVTRVVDKHATCLFITLNKSNNYYSPTTSYHDYSINSRLFHWQSQNATSPESTVGKRYINHKALNENILIFVREAKEDQYGSIPFTYLGVADYMSHEGSKPMSIIWKMKNKIPAKYLKITDKLGIG